MKIREYEPHDLPELIELFRRSVLEAAAAEYSFEQRLAWATACDDLSALAERLSEQMVAVYEMDDDTIAGFASMNEHGHLDFMYVHPEHLHQGIASTLYWYLEAWAGAQGIHRIFTEASLTSMPFFEKQGFEVIKRQSVECDGISLDNFRMEKHLLED